MTDYRSAGSLGDRIQAARKARGLSARELAEVIGGNPSQSTIENIELGRKAAIDIVQLLNIALAVRVPLSYLLAPMGMPNSVLDLPGLSHGFDGMTVAEFDAWLASVPGGAHIPSSLDERNAITELQALREWTTRSTDAERLEALLEIEASSTYDATVTYLRSTQERLSEAKQDIERLETFLRSAGWKI